MKITNVKIFGAVLVSCSLAYAIWQGRVHEDQEVRSHARNVQCQKAYADDARLSQTDAACRGDSVLQHYQKVEGAFVAGLIASGLGFVFSLALAKRETPGPA